ncbi:MAG: hypothetical protein O3B86_13145, partial [Planctomycetota bacterium]|nr:hypothetical protein [Planctomycetota bacterium]
MCRTLIRCQSIACDTSDSNGELTGILEKYDATPVATVRNVRILCHGETARRVSENYEFVSGTALA